MTEPQDVLAEALRATYDGGDGLGYRLVLMDESGGISTTLPDPFIEAIRAALVRTPETLDVERVVIEMEHEGVVTWGDERHRDRFLAATPSPTPPEGLLGSELEKAYRQGFDDGLARRARLAASPAPDPGAGLAEWERMDAEWKRLRRIEAAARNLNNFATWSALNRPETQALLDALAEPIAPSAEPPETEA